MNRGLFRVPMGGYFKLVDGRTLIVERDSD
jgi:hypothetical protein